METCTSAASPALQAANERLLALRRQRDLDAGQGSVAAPPPWDTAADPIPAGLAQLRLQLQDLPGHLGWGSERLSQHLRRQRAVEQAPAGSSQNTWWQTEAAEATEQLASSPASRTPQEEQPPPTWVKHYPDIGLAMLREEKTAPGRLWLMLRYLDQAGQGSFCLDDITKTLTDKASPYRLCGKRQLRNLLRDGSDLFWTRDKTRLWLRSAAKVACALGVDRLTNRPVALPVEAMTEGIGVFRAHLYAAFHSGRTKETPRGSQAMPIARVTLAKLSGLSPSSQRNYELLSGITTRINHAVGEQFSKASLETRAWQKGTAVFVLKDYRGRHGRAGQSYLAWQLPNSYLGTHQHRPKGRQKRINQTLKDLVNKGTPGNVGQKSDGQLLTKCYFPNAQMAAKVFNRHQTSGCYWPSEAAKRWWHHICHH